MKIRSGNLIWNNIFSTKIDEFQAYKMEQKPLTKISSSYQNYKNKQMNRNDINFLATK